MRRQRLVQLTLVLVLAAVALALLVIGVRAASRPSKAAVHIPPQVWQATADGGEAEFLVVLREQAQLDHVASISDRDARLHAVYDALRFTALNTQRSLRAELDAAGVSYRAFYIVNMLLVRGDRALLTRLATRSDVVGISANPRTHQAMPVSPVLAASSAAPSAVAWGVQSISATLVWSRGYTGTGIVVAGADTGYAWEHPALIRQYRGYDGITATHDYNWHDAVHEDGGVSCPEDSVEPCDGHYSYHGTHTMGTMVGDDGAGHQIGVAPGARWIGCRNMDGSGAGTPDRYAECFQFFLAPYPIGGDPFTDGEPSLAPHVINNSWSCTVEEGCEGVEITRTLQPIVEVLRAAGIVVVAAAGNSGWGCSSVSEPPAIYDAAFTVGATNQNDTIALTSSRGPVTVDGSGRPKPDISAPGVAISSSILIGNPYSYTYSYGTMGGTSMAAPHVAGAVALLWSAVPAFVGQVDVTEHTLMWSARPRVNLDCGGAAGGIPNNVYGWGIVDALGAIQKALGYRQHYLPLVLRG